jgi:hypothetical protein
MERFNTWTVLSLGSEGMMHAAMGAAHCIGVHWGLDKIKIRRFDNGESREELLLNYLKDFVASDLYDRDHHFAFFDDIYMRRYAKNRALSFGDLCRVFRRIRQFEGDTGNNILVFQTEDLEHLGWNHDLSHELGFTLKTNKSELTEQILETLGGLVLTQETAKRLITFLETDDAEPVNGYYFPIPVITKYRWDYEI